MEEESLGGRAMFPDARTLKSQPSTGWMSAVAGSCSNSRERNNKNELRRLGLPGISGFLGLGFFTVNTLAHVWALGYCFY